jgi:hypothetical protein
MALTELQKMGTVVLSHFRKMYDIHFNPTPMNVTIPRGSIDENGNLVDVTVKNKAKDKAEFEEWKNSAKNIMQYPFEHTIRVDGDVNAYYPIRLEWGCREPFHINIQRHFNAPFPASLGASHVGGLSLTLECCQKSWADFNFTKIKNFMFSYHHTIAKIQEYQMGRMLWLRGGGFEYKIKSDFNVTVSPPMLVTTTFNLNDDIRYPYTVSPIVAVDSMFTSNILTDTLI